MPRAALTQQGWSALAVAPTIALVLFVVQVVAMIGLIVLHKKHQPSVTAITQ
jgi:hypothetical protein